MPSKLIGFAYSESALRYLEQLPSQKLRRQIKNKIDSLASNPNPPTCKKLTGITEDGEPVYRIRSGDYRVLYLVRKHPNHIVILDIDDRKDVYR
jgi:mRNA interferase RelE/StbE